MSEPSGRPDRPGVIAFPPLILLVALALSIALEFVVPIAFLPAPRLTAPLSWIGALLIIAGIWLSVAGSREFNRQGTNVNPMMPALKLVTTGPYRFTRNPMYLGMAAGLAGVVLAFSLEMGIVVWVAFALVLNYGVVAREERYLTAKFGAPYRAFLGRTRRWL